MRLEHFGSEERIVQDCYRPQGKVMFSEALVSHSVHVGNGRQTSFPLEADPLERTWYQTGRDIIHPWKEPGTRLEVTSYTRPGTDI